MHNWKVKENHFQSIFLFILKYTQDIITCKTIKRSIFFRNYFLKNMYRQYMFESSETVSIKIEHSNIFMKYPWLA